MSGSDDGNVRYVSVSLRLGQVWIADFWGVDFGLYRIWKTNASTKLGPIDTRERQAIEYRRKLREKWGNEKGVKEVERYIKSHIPPAPLAYINGAFFGDVLGKDVFPDLSRMLQVLRRLCWMLARQRRRTGGNILGRESRSQRRRGRVSDEVSMVRRLHRLIRRFDLVFLVEIMITEQH